MKLELIENSKKTGQKLMSGVFKASKFMDYYYFIDNYFEG